MNKHGITSSQLQDIRDALGRPGKCPTCRGKGGSFIKLPDAPARWSVCGTCKGTKIVGGPATT